MGVYIKGLEMPINCWRCCLSQLYEKPRDMLVCKVTHEEVLRYKIDSNCPLISVHDHGDLIERDDLISFCVRNKTDEWNKQVVMTYAKALDEFEDIVQDAPTIIPADKEEQT